MSIVDETVSTTVLHNNVVTFCKKSKDGGAFNKVPSVSPCKVQRNVLWNFVRDERVGQLICIHHAVVPQNTVWNIFPPRMKERVNIVESKNIYIDKKQIEKKGKKQINEEIKE